MNTLLETLLTRGLVMYQSAVSRRQVTEATDLIRAAFEMVRDSAHRGKLALALQSGIPKTGTQEEIKEAVKKIVWSLNIWN